MTSTPPWTVAVSGSTGLIGSMLIPELLRDGHRVRRLVRGTTTEAANDITWEPAIGVLDPAALRGVDAVVHLSGSNIGRRWTPEVKREIRESRVKSTRLLAAAIASLEKKPRVMLVAGGPGIYGDRGDEILDEESSHGGDFLAQVGTEWEEAAEPAQRHGIRVVNARFGVAITPKGGPVERMLLPFKAGLGGRVGSGRQWLTWISLTDLVRAITFTLHETSLEGPVNLCSPNPVRNLEFTKALGDALSRPTIFRVPAFPLRLVYGEMPDATLLASQRVYPRKLEQSGFHWLHPDIRTALEAELRAE